MKKSILTFLSILLPLMACAQYKRLGKEGNVILSDYGIYYVTDDKTKTAYVTDCVLKQLNNWALDDFVEIPQYYKGDIVIPSKIGGYTVTAIGAEAFLWNSYEVTSITLPNTVTKIGGYAFNGLSIKSIDLSNVTTINDFAFLDCKYLESITLGNGLTSIGKGAFKNCSSLTSIDIPSSVTSIDEDAFKGCTSLTHVNVPKSVTSIGEDAFEDCEVTFNISDLSAWCSIDLDKSPRGYNNHLYLNGNEIKDLVVPNDVTRIGSYAFALCNYLTSVTIPKSVKTIGSHAFYGCDDLANLIIPSSVTSIEKSAFRNCTSLTSLSIPSSVTSIGSYAFNCCLELTSITVENGNKQYASPNNCNAIIETKTNKLIAGCKNSVIPNSVKTIGEAAFNGISLNSVDIPNSVKTIESYAFAGSSLSSVTIPSSVTIISEYAFGGCYNLTTISCFSNNPPTCKSNTFVDVDKENCVVFVPKGSAAKYKEKIGWKDFKYIKEIGANAKIENLIFDHGAIYEIGGSNTLTLKEVVNTPDRYEVPETIVRNGVKYKVVAIGNAAFNGQNVQDIILPESIERFEIYAFLNCSNLRTITFSERLVAIGPLAFAGCYKVQIINSYATEPPILGVSESRTRAGEASSVFEDVDKENCILYVPKGCVEKYRAAEGWGEFKNILEIGDMTGISNLTTDIKTYDVYDMSGRKVRTATTSLKGLTKGIYIVNGKKMLIK